MRARAFRFGFTSKRQEWKIETPHGVIWLDHWRDANGQVVIRVEVTADGERFAGCRSWVTVESASPEPNDRTTTTFLWNVPTAKGEAAPIPPATLPGGILPPPGRDGGNTPPPSE